MAQASHHFKVGAFECTILVDGGTVRTPAEAFPRVPEAELADALKSQGMTAGGQPWSYNVLLLRTGRHSVLVDAGNTGGSLRANLRAEGVTPADIDVLFLTHGDPDHVNGLHNEGAGLAFANARIVMWRGMWEHWTGLAEAGTLPERNQAFALTTLPLLGDRLELVEPEQEFLPGLTALYARGHRRDHAALWIESEGEALLHAGDALAHPLHFSHPSFATLFDDLPDEAHDTRRKLLARASDRGALIFAAHLPFPGLGRATPHGETWAWQPV